MSDRLSVRNPRISAFVLKKVYDCSYIKQKAKYQLCHEITEIAWQTILDKSSCNNQPATDSMLLFETLFQH